jgi:hypothetical protein
MSQQQADSEPPIARHHAETSPDEALKYWTAEKRRKAKPAHQPHVKNPGREKQSPQAPDTQKS